MKVVILVISKQYFILTSNSLSDICFGIENKSVKTPGRKSSSVDSASRRNTHVCIKLQWNPSIADSIGTNISVPITGVSSFQG